MAENSKRTRIEPVFGWLQDNGPPDWPDGLLRIADGLAVHEAAGPSGPPWPALTCVLAP